MDGKMILGSESLARHLCFLSLWFAHQQELLRAGWNGNTAWDTNTFVGWQQISLIIESKTLYGFKRLHDGKKDCVGGQRIFWVLEEEFDVSREQISVLYVVLTDYVCCTQTVCVLNIGANPEDCRQVVHVSHIQVLIFCIVTSNCVCHAQTLWCLSST